MTKPEARESAAAKPTEPNPAPLRPRSMQALVLAILVGALLTAVDLWTKTWAEENLARERMGEPPALCEGDYQRLPGEEYVLIEDVFDFKYAENCGAAFGLMRNAPTAVRKVVFGTAAFVAVFALFFLFHQGRGGPLFAYSVPLVASGALGNLIDRIRYGYVVDFIHVHYEPWSFDYPTFNVADIAITVGVILLVLDSFRAEPAEQPTAAPTKAPEPEPAASASSDEAAPPAGGADPTDAERA